jgi:hypothetical protein
MALPVYAQGQEGIQNAVAFPEAERAATAAKKEEARGCKNAQEAS